MGLNLRRPFELLRYFPPRFAAAMLLAEIGRKLIAPKGMVTYSMAGEDVLLSHYFDISKPGFYVDVGCNDPRDHSNTFFLYSHGWRGVAIDANASVLRGFKRMRPRDITVHAAVSNVAKEVTFALSQDSRLSTLSREFEGSWSPVHAVIDRIAMQSRTLQSILEEHQVPATFALLSIDVEGHDYEVLTSFDIHRFRPSVIVIECHDFRFDSVMENRVYSYLTGYGYAMTAFVNANAIFRDQRSV